MRKRVSWRGPLIYGVRLVHSHWKWPNLIYSLWGGQFRQERVRFSKWVRNDCTSVTSELMRLQEDFLTFPLLPNGTCSTYYTIVVCWGVSSEEVIPLIIFALIIFFLCWFVGCATSTCVSYNHVQGHQQPDQHLWGRPTGNEIQGTCKWQLSTV